MSTALHLRLSDDDLNEIREIAREADRPLAWMLARAVHEWLVDRGTYVRAAPVSASVPVVEPEELTREPDPDYADFPTDFPARPPGQRPAVKPKVSGKRAKPD